MEIKERIIELSEKLNYYNDRYYQDAVSEISDYEFDLLMKELEKLESQYPDLILPDSPTQRVGGKITKSFDTVTHRYPMMSLANSYNEQEIKDWDARVQKGLAGQEYEYVCEIKFDGISLSVSYQNGILTRGVTRGDGVQGDDISNNVKTIRTLPLNVKKHQDLLGENFEIRGEGFMPVEVFNEINRQKEEDGEQLLANPRNAAAGTFKLQDSSVVASRKLDCYVYQFITDNEDFNTHEESFIALKKAGFNVSQTWRKAKTIDEVIAYIHEWEEKRHSLPCATDGIVVKINSYAQREELGFTAKSPRWAIAYKYKPESKSTILKDVTYQVGRTGAVTPVAELEPVELSMTTVRRATLHNADEIERLGIAIGDHVFVEKAGEIIPKITGVDTSQPNPNRVPIVFPERCPACDTPLIRNEGEVAFYCPNTSGCMPQIKGSVEHFIQRKAMNIDSLGEGKIDILFEQNLIQDAADLYSLTYEQLFGIEKVHVDEETGRERRVSFQEKTVQNILDGLEKSKSEPFSKVLFGLGIRFVGETTAQKLASYFKNVDTLMAATQEELLNVPDVGEKVAQSVLDYFSDENNLKIIEKLREAGVTLHEEEIEKMMESNALEGLNLLYTGTFENFSRKELEERIASNGGKLVSSVSRKLNYLIVGTRPGASKVRRATELEVEMISEEEFLKMIND